MVLARFEGFRTDTGVRERAEALRGVLKADDEVGRFDALVLRLGRPNLPLPAALVLEALLPFMAGRGMRVLEEGAGAPITLEEREVARAGGPGRAFSVLMRLGTHKLGLVPKERRARFPPPGAIFGILF